jgi:hypothetical protein
MTIVLEVHRLALVYTDSAMKTPKIDERTRQYIRQWGRLEVPTAQVTGGDVTPGTYRAAPVLGWIERRGSVAIVGSHFILVRNQEYKPFGTLSIAMPVTKITELHINSFLHLLGWDGRVWPYDGDDGWPGTSPIDATNLRDMLRKVHRSSTFTFPPQDVGETFLNLPVVKRTAPYPLAPFYPLPEGAEPPIVHLPRFRELCRDPSPFEPLN